MSDFNPDPILNAALARLHDAVKTAPPPPAKRVFVRPNRTQLREPVEPAVHRGCPQDDERDYSFETAEPAPGLSHKEHVEQFNAESGGRDEVVLAALRKSFDERNKVEPYGPGKPGDWFTGFYFFKVFGIKAANSCACRLRQHPEVVLKDLDIDSSQVPKAERWPTLNRSEWWRYRLCHKADSERLKREANIKHLKEQAQTQFA